MKTTLIGKSNAILTELGFGIVGIIACSGGKNKDISKKLIKAIRAYQSIPEDIKITLTPIHPAKGNLTNQEFVDFSAEWRDKYGDNIRDYQLEIISTY